MKVKKDIKIEKVFGKEENRKYRTRRNTFFIVFVVLSLMFFFIRRYFNRVISSIHYLDLFNLISIFGAAIVIFCFYLADRSFEINFKKRHYLFIYIMAIVGISLSVLYFKLPYYDKIQHFFFPMMSASIAYFVILKKLKLSKFWRLTFVFFVIVGSLSIFELLEYFLDILFNWKLQGVFLESPAGTFTEVLGRLDDTMIDIGLGVLGVLIYVFSVAWIDRKKQK